MEENDENVAFDAICASSIIVMVHNIKMGMLIQDEVDWIKKIAEIFRNNEEQLKARFIFVNSWIDERMMDKSYQNTIKETVRVLNETLGTEVEVYNVSAKLYTKGISENKQKLIDLSNVLTLKDAILKKARYFAQNRQKFSWIPVEMCNDAHMELHEARTGIDKKISQVSASVSSDFQNTIKQWNSDFSLFKNLADNYNDTVRRLNNL